MRPRARRSVLTLGLAMALLGSGCGAVAGRMLPARFGGPPSRYTGLPFRGVHMDGMLLGHARGGWFALVLPLVVIDLPISFVLDLLLAPFELLGVVDDRREDMAARSVPEPAATPSPQGLEAPWRLLVGGDFEPARVGPGRAGLDGFSVVSPSATGRLRLAAVGGVRQRARGDGLHATCGAVISSSGDALLGFGRELLAAPANGVAPATLLWEAPAEAGRVVDVAQAADGRLLVTTTTQAFELTRGATGWTARALPGAERGLAAAWSPLGGRAATAGDLGVRLLELAPGREPGLTFLARSTQGWATALAFDGEEALWVGYADGALLRWSLAGGPTLDLQGLDRSAILALALHGDLVASAGASNLVVVRRIGQDVAPLHLWLEGLDSGGVVVDLAFSADGRELLVAALDGVVRRLDLATRLEVDRVDLRPIDDRPRRVAFLTDGGVAVVTERGTLLRYASP